MQRTSKPIEFIYADIGNAFGNCCTYLAEARHDRDELMNVKTNGGNDSIQSQPFESAAYWYEMRRL